VTRWKADQQDYDHIFSLSEDPVCVQLTFRQVIFIQAALGVFNWRTRWYSPTDATIDKDNLEAFVAGTLAALDAGLDGECTGEGMPSQYIKSIEWCSDPETRDLRVINVIDGVESEELVALSQCLTYIQAIQPCEEEGKFTLCLPEPIPGPQGDQGIQGIQGIPGECEPGCNEAPPLPDVPVEEGVDTLCQAAWNAEAVLYSTYLQADAIFPASGGDVLSTAGALIAFIAAVILFPPSITIVAPIVAAWLLAEITINPTWFDADLRQQLRCILFCNATLDGAKVTFDYEQVATEVGALISTAPGDEPNVWRVLDYILDIIGADGLNIAGTTGAATDVDCVECEPCDGWCYEWDFTVDNGTWANWQPAGRGQAGYEAGLGWHQINPGTPANADAIAIRKSWTTDIGIVKIAVYFDHTMTGTNPWIRVGEFSEVTSLAQNPTPNNPQVWEGSWTWNGIAVLVNQAEGAGVSYFTTNHITRVKIYGNGDLPSALSSAGGFSPCNF
jgi:hypothetical protein